MLYIKNGTLKHRFIAVTHSVGNIISGYTRRLNTIKSRRLSIGILQNEVNQKVVIVSIDTPLHPYRFSMGSSAYSDYIFVT